MYEVSIKLAEGKISSHIQMGGDFNSEVGKSMVCQLIDKALKNTKISQLCRDYNINHSDLCKIYIDSIRLLMPMPWIKPTGGVMLIPTLFFMEPSRLEAILLAIFNEVKVRGIEDKNEIIEQVVYAYANKTRDVFDEKYGPVSMEILALGGRKTAGCLPMLVMLALPSVAFLYYKLNNY